MDPQALLSFIFSVIQYGGAVIAGIGAIWFVKAGKDRDSDARMQATWVALGGVAAFLVGGWLGGMSFPTI